MKTTARILSALLALALVFSLSATAFAADYEESVANIFTGIPANAEDLVYISADGSDEDSIPDLVKGYYVYNSDDLTFAGRNTPTWDTFYGSSVYVKSATNYWGVNRGEGAKSQSGGGQDDKGYFRDKDGFRFYSHLIHVGVDVMGNCTPLEHGIGVKPSKPEHEIENYVLVDVDGYSHFYAIAGITGSAFNQNATNIPEDFGGTGVKGYSSNTGANTVVYEIWGSPNVIADTEAESKAVDSSFTLIASGEIGATKTGEFNVDVSGCKTLKLVTKVGETTKNNGGTECVWGNASLYNLPEGSAPSTPVEPSKPSVLPNVASGNYKPNSSAGLSSDKAATATDISVSDLVVGSYVYPASGSTDPRPVNVDAGFKGAALAIGGNTYTDGFGLHPSPASDATESYVLLDVSNVKGNRFYSMVGITGNAKNNTEQGVVFRVYGGNSVDGEFTLLASSGGLYGTSTGEFDVYIGDYKYLKLELDSFEGDHSSRAAAWVNPVIYEGNPGTADTFSALPVALLVLSGIAVVAMVAKKKED